MDAEGYARELVEGAREACAFIGNASTDLKNRVLEALAENLLEHREELKEENRKDLEAAAEAGLSTAMIDRLELNDRRIEGMAGAVRKVAALQDPVGRVIDGWVRPNGLKLRKVRVPLGVICMIYESRPNVTADAAALCLKSGNAVILRGGKEAINSNLAVHHQIVEACRQVDMDPRVVQVVEIADRAVVPPLLQADGYVDLVIPRGGKGLIRTVADTATVPVIKHYEGICHTYVDRAADLEMAVSVCRHAKCQRPGVCNAMETLLVHVEVAEEFFAKMHPVYREEGVELRGCPRACKLMPGIAEADEKDWSTEYLDLTLSVRVVQDLDGALRHIARYGSGHSDAILTEDVSAARRFMDEVDSAAVFLNTTTRWHDGEQFGLGAEIGISTDKLHARGPMALEELTSYKWLVIGEGQLRE